LGGEFLYSSQQRFFGGALGEVHAVGIRVPYGLPQWLFLLAFAFATSGVGASRFAVLTCFGQAVDDAAGIADSQLPAAQDERFASPQSTFNCFRAAVKDRVWCDEFACYSPRLQAKFTYHIVMATRELADSEDLKSRAETIIQQHGLPADVLDLFPSLKTDLSHFESEASIQLKLANQQQALQVNLDRWALDFFPLDVDWSSVICKLQPLFEENVHRNQEPLHPSQNGIVSHLDYHLYDRVWKMTITEARAVGLVVERLRDPSIELMVDEKSTNRLSQAWKSSIFHWRNFTSLDAWQGRVGREPARVELIKQADGWKLDSVPGR
jgi:hypothetical protein